MKRLVAVLTRNPRLTFNLTAELIGRFRLLIAETCDELDELLSAHRPDALLLDLSGVRGSGEAECRFIARLRERHAGAQLCIIAADDAPAALRQTVAAHGGTLLGRDPDFAALAASWDQQSNADMPSQPNPEPQAAAEGWTVGGRDADDFGAETVLTGISRRFETNSPQLKAMLRDLEVAARHNVTILLIGETGSGKTFLSKLIHEVSPRRDEPFLHVACGALPNELIESELFGHVKGSFTSAHADKEGKFVAAGRGTVLLDEIDVLGLEQQVKLLKVIETGEFEPVGSNKTLRSQARLVVASNLNLQPLVEQGHFRPDLYYRLNMLKFEIPPLRSRKADVMPLAKKFIKSQCEKHGVTIHRIERGLFDALYNYPWPGNVRELENVIQRAVIYCQGGVLTADHLPPHVLSGDAGPANDPTVQLVRRHPSHAAAEPDSLGSQIALTEKEIIEQALFHNQHSRTNTAKELGISRVTLYNKMKKYGMMK
jgi:DNA-binding NtrC family response regulator